MPTVQSPQAACNKGANLKQGAIQDRNLVSPGVRGRSEISMGAFPESPTMSLIYLIACMYIHTDVGLVQKVSSFRSTVVKYE